jgi:hypothetical protein
MGGTQSPDLVTAQFSKTRRNLRPAFLAHHRGSATLMNFAARRSSYPSYPPSVSCLIQPWKIAGIKLNKCRALPSPPCPSARGVDVRTRPQRGPTSWGLSMRLWAGRGLHSQESARLCYFILQAGQKISLSCARVDSSRLRCTVNHHCAAGKTRSSSKKPSTPVDHI